VTEQEIREQVEDAETQVAELTGETPKVLNRHERRKKSKLDRMGGKKKKQRTKGK
jgi:hypothetical protein